MAAPLVTKSELIRDIADGTGLSRADVMSVFDSLDEIVPYYLEEVHRVRIGNLVQLEVKVSPAKKARMGRNPATGEEIEIPKKPASAKVAVRLLKGAKEAVPSVQKARNRLKK
jgi:nucleoid DNA-binding protein